MLKIFILSLILTSFSGICFASDPIYYTPEDWRGYDVYFADVMFSDYDENGDYLILAEMFDYNVCGYVNPKLEKENKKKFKEHKPRFLEYRCIKPEGAVKAGKNIFHEYINGEYVEKLVGYTDENCDCSKWEFYADERGMIYDKKLRRKVFGGDFVKKEKGACFGYREYSWKEFKKLAPKIREFMIRDKRCGELEEQWIEWYEQNYD